MQTHLSIELRFQYKVATGTQEQRGVLLDGQGGGRDGSPNEDADDYDVCNFF